MKINRDKLRDVWYQPFEFLLFIGGMVLGFFLGIITTPILLTGWLVDARWVNQLESRRMGSLPYTADLIFVSGVIGFIWYTVTGFILLGSLLWG